MKRMDSTGIALNFLMIVNNNKSENAGQHNQSAFYSIEMNKNPRNTTK